MCIRNEDDRASAGSKGGVRPAKARSAQQEVERARLRACALCTARVCIGARLPGVHPHEAAALHRIPQLHERKGRSCFAAFTLTLTLPIIFAITFPSLPHHFPSQLCLSLLVN